MLNNVALIGNLGKNPELRYTTSGQAVCNFSLATNEIYKDKNGVGQKKTTWHNIVIWGKLAEAANTYLTKGATVYLGGKIDNRSYDDKNGNKQFVTEIICDTMKMLGGKRRTQQEPDDNYEPLANDAGDRLSDSNDTDNDLPF